MRAPCVARVWLDACAGIAPPPHERSRPYLPFTEATSEIDVLRGIFALRTAKLPSNVLTLSCKNRLTCMAREAARRLPRLTRSDRSELQPTCRVRAVGAARGGG